MRPLSISRRNIYFFLFCAVLYTTVFSLLRINTYCIILLVAFRLWDAPDTARSVFKDKLFLAYFFFVLIETAGFLHTDNIKLQSDAVAKDATLVAFAYVLCSGALASGREYRRLMEAYCLMIFLSSVYCLVMAFRHYLVNKDPADYFYHTLTVPISQNAVFYSVYLIFGILFLLSAGQAVLIKCTKSWWNGIRIFLVLFFLLMMVLLSSKLSLILTLIILCSFFLRQFSFRRNRLVLGLAGIALLLVVSVFSVIDNPIRRRFADLANGNLEMVRQQKFPPGTDFNGLQLRLLEWRFAREVLHENHAWLFGVSPGNSQNLLDAKYVAAEMYIGNPAEGPRRHIRGFLGYNFHNQYIESLVRDGILGLMALLAIFLVLARRAGMQDTREAFFTILTLALFFVPQSPLTMQQGVFLFCFFPLSILCLRKSQE
jgi:O-antigen ligase